MMQMSQIMLMMVNNPDECFMQTVLEVFDDSADLRGNVNLGGGNVDSEDVPGGDDGDLKGDVPSDDQGFGNIGDVPGVEVSFVYRVQLV